MAISRMQQPREMYQDGSIMPRLDQLGSGVSSAEQTLQGITQRLESAESSLGNGEGSLQPLQTADGLGAYPNLKIGDSFSDNVPIYLRPGNIPGTNIPFSTFRDKGIDIRNTRDTTLAPSLLNVTKPETPMALQSPLGNAMRNMAANGGIQEPRQLYGLGSFVKSIGKKLKKIVKSPIGKAALLGLGAYGLGGGSFFGKMLPGVTRGGQGIGGFGGLSSIFGNVGDIVGGSGLGDKFAKFAGSTGGKFLTGGALTGILAGAGMGAQEMQEIKRDPEKLKIYLRDYISKTNPDFTDAQVEEEVNINVSEYMAKGGRVGLMDGAMPTGIMRANKAGTIERDYRETGGFVPVGIKEKADDVPAMLSKNEFVMTADAVRGIGDGDIEKGAQRLYDQMKQAEKRVV